MTRVPRLLVLLGLSLAVLAPATADWVVLKDRRKFAGNVKELDGAVEVTASDGAVRRFARTDVDRVLESPRDLVRESERACDQALALFQEGGKAADLLERNRVLRTAVERLESALGVLERYREIFPEEQFAYLDTAYRRVVKDLKLCRERMVTEGGAGEGGAVAEALPTGKSRDELLADLQAEDAAVRRLAALALGAKREEKALPDLVRRLRAETDAALRAAVCEVLGRAPAAPVVTTFAAELAPDAKPGATFREDACTVLGRVATAEAFDLLARLALDPASGVRPGAVAALRGRRALAARRVAPLLNQAETAPRRVALDLLVEVGGPEAAQALVPLLALPDELADRREEAADGLLKLKGAAVPALVDALLDVSLRDSAHRLLRAITHQEFAAGEVIQWQQWVEEHRAELLR
ncbi:MAG: hypothetical protein HZA54_02620 [Planctomycetes bacterium]|nr:hypothetical protein [Planctomycetota bacterium]